MIVQPASIGPRSRPRRVLRVVGIALPVVLLLGVVGIGVLGPAPAPAPTPRPRASGAPVVAVSDPTPAPDPTPDPMAPVFPSRIAGLTVHGVHWTLEARNRGLARGVIAVAGYLGLEDVPAACRDSRMGIFGAFCARVGLLGEDPWQGGPTSSPDAPGFHLHPQFPAGVGIPSQATFVAASPGTTTPAVIVLARFNDERAERCVPGGRHCGQELVVERVAWVEGQDFPRTIALDPALGDVERTGATLLRSASLARSALPSTAYPLLTVLVAPGTIARIEPAAAADAATLDPAQGVWFVRGLDIAGDPSTIDWLIVDPEGRRVLATGRIDTVRFPGQAGGAPSPGASTPPEG